jgi:hypothetical protein
MLVSRPVRGNDATGRVPQIAAYAAMYKLLAKLRNAVVEDPYYGTFCGVCERSVTDDGHADTRPVPGAPALFESLPPPSHSE